ncbi:16360_t:CDS:1, partial [Funneliformis caledonium]
DNGKFVQVLWNKVMPSSPSSRDVLGKRRSIDIIAIILQIFLLTIKHGRAYHQMGNPIFES